MPLFWPLKWYLFTLHHVGYYFRGPVLSVINTWKTHSVAQKGMAGELVSEGLPNFMPVVRKTMMEDRDRDGDWFTNCKKLYVQEEFYYLALLIKTMLIEYVANPFHICVLFSTYFESYAHLITVPR